MQYYRHTVISSNERNRCCYGNHFTGSQIIILLLLMAIGFYLSQGQLLQGYYWQNMQRHMLKAIHIVKMVIGPDMDSSKRKIANIFLPNNLYKCFGAHKNRLIEIWIPTTYVW